MKKKIQSPKRPIDQQDGKFANNYFDLMIQIQKQDHIFKDSKELKGRITMIPRFLTSNIPIQISIFGQSQCSRISVQETTQALNIQSFYGNQPKSFRIYATQQSIVEQKQQKWDIQRCLQSTEQMSDNHNQNNSTILQQYNKQTFFEGKQTHYQVDEQGKQKLKSLQPNTPYFYPFQFILPHSLPISANQAIFSDIHLYVGYKIQVLIKIDDKFILYDKEVKNSLFQNENQIIQLQKTFKIRSKVQRSHQEIITNKLSFKYFHSNGSQTQFQILQKCNCLKYFYKLFKGLQQTKFDVYHCQILASVNNYNTLHIRGRIFLEPLKDRLDQRKVKKGKMYMTSKKQTKQDLSVDQKVVNNKSQLTISKILEHRQTNVKVQMIKIKMYGELSNIKKHLIFQRDLNLNQKNYDMVQGQFVVQISNKFFSQKNQLFQIKYWFQIQPLSQSQPVNIFKNANKIESKQKNSNKSRKCKKIQQQINNLVL